MKVQFFLQRVLYLGYIVASASDHSHSRTAKRKSGERCERFYIFYIQ